MLVPFSPKPGLNSDDTTFAAEGRWADGNNVRFHLGKPQTVGGREQQFAISSSAGCTAILPFTRSGTLTVAYGLSGGGVTTSALYVGTGLGAPTARTPASLANTDTFWSLAAYGSTLLANPEGGTLYEQTGTSTATEATEAPNRIDAGILATLERQVLAFGANEVAGSHNPLCIRGSDLEDYSSAGSWTPTSTNNAFEHILDGSGRIVAGRIIGPFVAVWTNASLYLGQFIGDPAQTYRFDRVDDGCGLIGEKAVTVFGGIAYWLGPDLRFWSWSPGTPPEPLLCPISKAFRDSANIAGGFMARAVASFNSRFNEIRFDYAALSGDPATGNTRYVAVCLTDGSWYRGIGGREAIVDSALLASSTTASAGNPTILAAYDRNTVKIQLEDTGPLAYTGANTTYIRSADQYLDSSQRRMMIRGIVPDFEDLSASEGIISLTLFVRDRPQSSATEKGPYNIDTSATKKDFRASGKVVAVRLGATFGQGTLYFRLGKPLFDIVPLGER